MTDPSFGGSPTRDSNKSKRQRSSLVATSLHYNGYQGHISCSKDRREKTHLHTTQSPDDSLDDLDYSKEDTSFEDEKLISDSDESQQGDILGSPMIPQVANVPLFALYSNVDPFCWVRPEKIIPFELSHEATPPLIAIKVNNLLTCAETLEEDSNSTDLPQHIEVHIPTKDVEQQRFAFSLLPDEILLLIFKFLPGPWKELVRLRAVCKHWSVLLKDASLKYGKLSEDLFIMLNNEKKHYGQIRDYLGPSGKVREITSEMRAILVDWLVEVVEEFRLQSETLFLTVHYIDRYLSLTEVSINRGKLQLLGITSLLIASKYEEIYVPAICDIVYIADNTYTKDEILLMELNLLNSLKFDICVCTIKRFVEYFLKTAEDGVPVEDKQRSTLENLAGYIAELSLVEYRFSIKRPSLIGASIVCLALHALGLTWTYILERECHYSLDELNGCVQDLWKLVSEAPTSHLQAIYTKYAQKKFDSVSTRMIDPPCLGDAKINFIS